MSCKEMRAYIFRSVDALLGQVSSNTRDLDGLQDKIDANLSKHLDVREELLKQKDAQIKGEQLFNLCVAIS